MHRAVLGRQFSRALEALALRRAMDGQHHVHRFERGGRLLTLDAMDGDVRAAVCQPHFVGQAHKGGIIAASQRAQPSIASAL